MRRLPQKLSRNPVGVDTLYFEPAPGTIGWIIWRTRQIIRREGSRGLFFRALAALGYQRLGWFVRSLATPLEPLPSQSGIQLVELRPAHVEDYLLFRRGATREDFLERLESGKVCHGAFIKGRIGSVTWTSVGQAELLRLNYRFSLLSDEVYLHDSFTHSDFRGQRLQAVLFARIYSEYKNLGYQWAISLIVPENRPSIASRQRLGFQQTGLLKQIRVGKKVWFFFQGKRRLPDQGVKHD